MLGISLRGTSEHSLSQMGYNQPARDVRKHVTTPLFITLGVHTERKFQIKSSQNSAKISNTAGLSSSASAHVRRSNILNVSINFRLHRLGSQTCSRRLCMCFLVRGEGALRLLRN